MLRWRVLAACGIWRMILQKETRVKMGAAAVPAHRLAPTRDPLLREQPGMDATILMGSHACKLFGTAALFNFLVALALLFLRPQLGPLVRLDPVTGTNLVFVYLAAGLVAVFGYAYLRIAQDPERFRPFIELGVIGKLLAVGAVTWPWLTGEIGWQLPLVVSGDAVYALLFINFLRRTRRA